MLTNLRLAFLRNLLGFIMARQFPPELSLVQQRAVTESSVARYFKTLPGVQVETISANGVPADWVRPANQTSPNILLYLHGGGYTTGSPRTHRDLVARLVLASGFSALVPEYRLAPEHPFPAALDDALAAYHYLIAQGHAPHQIVIGGDSAGGGLTLALLLALRDAGEPLPAAAVCLSPMTDLTFTSPTIRANDKRDPIIQEKTLRPHAERYRAGQDPHLPLLSPLFANLHGLPPLLIHVGTHEILLNDSTAFADHARQQGVTVTLTIGQGLWHVWHIYAAFLPEARQALAEIAAFLKHSVPSPLA
jgi:acetyl esterase/lipase